MLTHRTRLVAPILFSFLLVPVTRESRGQEFKQIVDFRDGTVLQMTLPDQTLPWRRITKDGRIIDEPVKLSDVQHIRFVLTPATEQVAEVRRTVAKLGDADFHVRRKAHEELLRSGAKYRNVLEEMLPQMDDFEVRWRLKEILDLLPADEALLSNDYDKMILKGSDQEVHGDVGRWTLKANYRGAEVLIDRAGVLAIRNEPLDFNLAAEPEVVDMQRIPSDDDENFPEDITWIDFDKGPLGEALPPDTNVSETYVPLGVTISTSIEDSYVGIAPYNVGGRSGGRCAATMNPLYQGTITIRFCKPGNARLPAGVRYVGFWTSHVSPEGTALQAFDGRGRQIAEIKTVRAARDFLCIKTNVPIAYVKIVPDKEIDPDYAIDDLVFDTPKALSEAGEPDRFSVVLTSGERLHSQRLDRQDDVVTLTNLTIGVKELQIGADDIAVFVPPRIPVPEVQEDTRPFLRLVDGSVIRAKKTDDGIEIDRFTALPVDANRLIALWGATTMLEQPRDFAWPENRSVLMIPNKEPIEFSDWKLGKDWIESSDLADVKDNTYENSPVVWFRKPPKRPADSGLLRTTSGEEIVLGTTDGFTLEAWSLNGVVVSRGENRWRVPLSEVSSLLMPKQN